jgi:urease accessory protein
MAAHRSLLARLARCALPAFLGAAFEIALAHTGSDGAAHRGIGDALGAGFAHPLGGIDHLCAMVSIGIWSALATRRIWLAPLVFACMLLIGALLGFAGLALPAVEPMIATSLLVLGLLVALRTELPAALGLGLVSLFALFHGLVHGQELGGPFGAWALTGMVVATMLLHVAGLFLGVATQRRSRWLPRIAGAGVALVGLWLLAPALTASAG